MLPKIKFAKTASYQKLMRQAERMKNTHMRKLFQRDPARFDTYSMCFEGILLDYSKNRIDKKVMNSLFKLASECQLDQAILAFFNGELINQTERRAVMHTALRTQSDDRSIQARSFYYPSLKKCTHPLENRYEPR